MNTNTRILGLLLGATLLSTTAAASEPPRSPRSGTSRAERLELLRAAPRPAADPVQAEPLPRAVHRGPTRTTGPRALGVSVEGVLDRIEDGRIVLGEEVPESLRRKAAATAGRDAAPRRLERVLNIGPGQGRAALRKLVGKRVKVAIGRDGTGQPFAMGIEEAAAR